MCKHTSIPISIHIYVHIHACMHIHTSIYTYILFTACGPLKHQRVMSDIILCFSKVCEHFSKHKSTICKQRPYKQELLGI